jgi:hypothetical protein
MTQGIQWSALSQMIYGVEPLQDFGALELQGFRRHLHTTPKISRMTNSQIFSNLRTPVLNTNGPDYLWSLGFQEISLLET